MNTRCYATVVLVLLVGNISKAGTTSEEEERMWESTIHELFPRISREHAETRRQDGAEALQTFVEEYEKLAAARDLEAIKAFLDAREEKRWERPMYALETFGEIRWFDVVSVTSTNLILKPGDSWRIEQGNVLSPVSKGTLVNGGNNGHLILTPDTETVFFAWDSHVLFTPVVFGSQLKGFKLTEAMLIRYTPYFWFFRLFGVIYH